VKSPSKSRGGAGFSTGGAGCNGAWTAGRIEVCGVVWNVGGAVVVGVCLKGDGTLVDGGFAGVGGAWFGNKLLGGAGNGDVAFS
jgi:hypothetical protein